MGKLTFGFHKTFKKQYDKVSIKVKDQFDERFRLFKQEPFHPILKNHQLFGDRAGQWSINVTGDWRAVYFFKDKETVVFIDLDTHSNLYK